MQTHPIRSEDRLAVAIDWARTLGPASQEALARPWARRCLSLRLARGELPRDAAIAVLARRARRDGLVAGELLRDVMGELGLYGSSVLPPLLRRLHDGDDLVVSVLGDCFGELFKSRVEGRGQLMALLHQRIKWKTLNHSRQLLSLKRREDLRHDEPPAEMDLWCEGPSPLEQAVAREEMQRLVQRLRALPEIDRAILEQHFAGLAPPQIGERLGLTPEIVRRAMKRLLHEVGMTR